MVKAVCKYDKSQSVTLWFVYMLYLLFIPALIGFFISNLKSKQYSNCAHSTDSQLSTSLHIVATHHDWLVRTFVFVSMLVMIGFGTMYLGVGYIVAAAGIVWWFGRTIKGMIALAHNKAMPS